jgi:hypothetical protein
MMLNKQRAILVITALSISSVVAADPPPTDTEKEQRANKPDGVSIVDSNIQIKLTRATNNNGAEIGATPTISFSLWGKAGSEDKIIVTWKRGAQKIGKPTMCDVPDISDEYRSGSYDDQGEVQCEAKKDEALFPAPGVYSAEIGLRSTETQKTKPLRTLTFTVKSYAYMGNKEHGFYADRDGLLKEHFAYWDPESDTLALRSWVKQAPEWEIGESGKLKCTVNGKDLSMTGNVYESSHFEYKDSKDKGARWSQLEGKFYNAPRDGKDKSKKWEPGKYECKMLAGGKVVRIFRFELEKDLKIAVSPQQSGKGGIVSRSTFLPSVEISGGADTAYDKNALPFWGKSVK